MSKATTIVIACIGVLMLNAVSTGTVLAAEWYVGGSPLTGSANLATEAVTDKAATLSSPGLNIKIACSGNLLERLTERGFGVLLS